MLVPVRSLKSSAEKWCRLPGPMEAKLSWPGFALASATNSFTECAGTAAFTTITTGESTIIPIGANDVRGS